VLSWIWFREFGSCDKALLFGVRMVQGRFDCLRVTTDTVDNCTTFVNGSCSSGSNWHLKQRMHYLIL